MKKIITLLASAALIASGLHILPAAAAEEAPAIPATVNIEDPADDANYVNNQGLPIDVPGDNVTPRDVSTLGDILKVWFTNDADKANVHIQTQAAVAEGGNNAAIFFRVQVDPDGAGDPCLWFQGGTTGTNNLAGAVANLRSVCGGEDEVLGDGELTVAVGPEDTGLYTISVPRDLHASLGQGGSLLAPIATSRNYWNTTVRSATAPQIDDTLPGTDYLMTEAKPAKAKKKTPGKNNPPGKKKGCKKGKGKKRGCEGKGKKSPKPGRPSARCAPFKSPNDAFKDKPLVLLTDDATEEKPVEQTATMDASLADLSLGLTSAGPFAATGDIFNIQVDSKSKEVGLYALLEFAPRRDYDLNLFHDDGSYAAQARSFNTAIETPFSVPGHGGEGTDHSEKLVGIKTADCGGWSLAAENHFGEGGELTVKLWLGEAQIDPLEPGKETP